MITIKMNTQQINQLKQDYQHADFRYDIQYTLFQVKDDGVTITAYQSGKVVFAGKNASMHAAKYGVKTEPIKPTVASFPMSGSDEVGTGDYFDWCRQDQHRHKLLSFSSYHHLIRSVTRFLRSIKSSDKISLGRGKSFIISSLIFVGLLVSTKMRSPK